VDVDRLRLVLLRLSRRIRSSYAGEVTPSQLTVMATLGRHGPLTVGQIAEREHVRPPSASKIVGALEQAGLVRRTIDPTDRRCQPIELTDAGVAFVERARHAGRSFVSARLDDLDTVDLDAIATALPALERLLGSIE
jgi:DNA-binding MarR family transcriptional regulator